MFSSSVIGKVVATKRLASSVNGNPRFRVSIEQPFGDTVEFDMALDTGLAYEIQNAEYRDNTHEFDIVHGKLSGYVR